MNILFLNHNTLGRGTYLRCFNLGRNLVRLGHRVTLLTSAPCATLARREQLLNGVRVITMPEIAPKRVRNGGLGPLDTCSRIAHVMTNRYDVVHAFDHRPAVSFPALVAKYVRKQVLVSEWTDLWGNGGIMDERPRWIRWTAGMAESGAERHMRSHADAITSICSELERRSRDAAGEHCPSLRLPGGADTDTVRPSPLGEARERTGLPPNAPILAYVGFTQYDRRFLLQAFALVAAHVDDARLLLIGPKGTDVAGHPAAGRIHQTGVLTPAEMSDWLAAANVTLLPFLNRGVNRGRWPNKVGDYMAAGRPIVANRTGDLIELFERYEIGLLADDSPEDFARCAIDLLNNPELASRMGANALRCAQEDYSWAKLSERLADFYEEAIATRQAIHSGTAAVAETRTA
jgi:glycosyltransferase involved in cell wall biosynthesis